VFPLSLLGNTIVHICENTANRLFVKKVFFFIFFIYVCDKGHRSFLQLTIDN